MTRQMLGISLGLVLMGGTATWALDAQNYQALKTAGVCSMSKNLLDKTLVTWSCKHYDPIYGTVLPTTVEPVDQAALAQQKASAQKTVDAIGAIQADIAALP